MLCRYNIMWLDKYIVWSLFYIVKKNNNNKETASLTDAFLMIPVESLHWKAKDFVLTLLSGGGGP